MYIRFLTLHFVQFYMKNIENKYPGCAKKMAPYSITVITQEYRVGKMTKPLHL